MTKLKSCPFCGKDSGRVHVEAVGYFEYHRFIFCENCEARTAVKSCESGAVAAWNRRAAKGGGKMTQEVIIRKRRGWMVYQPIAGADFVSFNKSSAQSWGHKYGERGYKVKPVTISWKSKRHPR